MVIQPLLLSTLAAITLTTQSKAEFSIVSPTFEVGNELQGQYYHLDEKLAAPAANRDPVLIHDQITLDVSLNNYYGEAPHKNYTEIAALDLSLPAANISDLPQEFQTPTEINSFASVNAEKPSSPAFVGAPGTGKENAVPSNRGVPPVAAGFDNYVFSPLATQLDGTFSVSAARLNQSEHPSSDIHDDMQKILSAFGLVKSNVTSTDAPVIIRPLYSANVSANQPGSNPEVDAMYLLRSHKSVNASGDFSSSAAVTGNKTANATTVMTPSATIPLQKSNSGAVRSAPSGRGSPSGRVPLAASAAGLALGGGGWMLWQQYKERQRLAVQRRRNSGEPPRYVPV